MNKNRRYWLPFTIGLVSLGLASCGERSPVAVDEPSRSLVSDVLALRDSVTGLLSCTPLAADSITQVIGPAGGMIQVGPHKLTVPAGALDSAVSITAVAPSGTVNRIVFQPTGLVFGRAVWLTMSYANCNTLGSMLPKRVAYVDDLLTILYYLRSFDNFSSQTVTARVRHFSDYAVAW